MNVLPTWWFYYNYINELALNVPTGPELGNNSNNNGWGFSNDFWSLDNFLQLGNTIFSTSDLYIDAASEMTIYKICILCQLFLILSFLS